MRPSNIHIFTLSALSFKLSALSLLFIGLALLFSGCEQQDGGPINPTGTPPVLANGSITPDRIDVDALVPSNSLYTIQTSARVMATDAEDDITVVVARVLRRNSSNTLLEVPLYDDGTGEDSLANDNLFSGPIEFQIPREEAGAYRIEFLANDANSDLSNLVGVTLYANRSNSPPSLDSASFMAPDTVTLPIGGSILIPMSVAVQDSDGIADVRSVFFLSLDGGNPTFRYPLKDDGGFDPGPPSGDPVAGDGIFWILLPASDSPTIRGSYRLLFHAEDTFGDTSATLLHVLTIE